MNIWEYNPVGWLHCISLCRSFCFLCLSLLCLVCSAFLLRFSSYQKSPHPTSLERKLDIEVKRGANACKWSKRRTYRKSWLWNDIICRDVTSARELSIVERTESFTVPKGREDDATRSKVKNIRAATSNEEFMRSNFQADPMRWRCCGAACGKSSDSQLTSSL